MWCTLLSIQRSKYLNKVMLLSGTEHHQMKRWWYTHQWRGCRRLTAPLKFLSSTLGGNHFEPTRNDIPPNSDASCHVGLGFECLTAKRVWLKWPRAHLWLSVCIKYAVNCGLFFCFFLKKRLHSLHASLHVKSAFLLHLRLWVVLESVPVVLGWRITWSVAMLNAELPLALTFTPTSIWTRQSL